MTKTELIRDLSQAQKPKILVLGHARHGKDTVGEILRDRYGLTFESSSFFLAAKVVRPEMERRGITYGSLDECYADRVNHRALWREIIGEYNGKDPSLLARSILEVADMYVGMRTQREYVAAIPLFDVIVWVDASGRGVPPEGRDSMTIEYDQKTMKTINNDGTLADLEREVDDFIADVREGFTTDGGKPLPFGM